MKEQFDRLSAKLSRVTARSHGNNLVLGIRFLDRRLQEPMYAIYGFVRLARQLVDVLEVSNKAFLVDQFKNDLLEAIDSRVSLNPVLNSFQQVVHRYGIERQLIIAFLGRMGTGTNTVLHIRDMIHPDGLGLSELSCLMCLFVFVENDRGLYYQLMPSAMRIGSAFQKICFLRRPVEHAEGNGKRFPGIVAGQISWQDKEMIEAAIENELREAFVGIRLLPDSSRFGVYLTYQYFRKLFEKIKLTGACADFSKPFALSNARKFVLMCDVLLKRQMHLI